MAIELPNELWLHIVSFLPPHLVRRLIGVNRLLFNLAQDVISADMHLGIDWQSKFDAMSDSDLMILARRVRHLYIDAHVVQWQPESRSKGVLGKLTAWRKTTRDDVRTRIWQNTVERLVNLQHLTVDCANNLSSVAPFFISILSTSYQSLSVLSITTSWVDLSESGQCFFSLPDSIIQAFTLTLTGPPPFERHFDGLTQYLGPVLLTQAKTLTSLSLSSDPGSRNFAAFFSLLADKTLRLSKLALKLDFEAAWTGSLEALNALLQSKRETLESLSLRTSSEYGSRFHRWYSTHFSRFEFPRLHSLEFDFDTRVFRYLPPMPSIQLPFHGLTALVLWNHFDNLYDILEPFSHSFVALESLGVTIKNFEVDALEELSTLFPLLHHLDVRFLRIGHHEQDISQPFRESEQLFCLRCTDPSLGFRWNLREITVRQFCKKCLKLRRSSLEIERAIGELIPSTRYWVEMMADAPSENQMSCRCLRV
ncbi:hypothetical protein C8J56DRAFT_1163920 [Mycena floridula]|nr:hypothetical protein C8J56DRAFT_1163920 [Mycena floridula]